MKPIDVGKLRAEMEANGYNNKKLSVVLRCSEQTVSNIFNRETMQDDCFETIEAIFDKPRGYFDKPESGTAVQHTANNDELLKTLNQFSVNTFSYQMSLDKSMKQLNDTAMQILAALNNLKKSVDKLEGVANNNTSKVTTAIAKVRTDTEALKTAVADIGRTLK